MLPPRIPDADPASPPLLLLECPLAGFQFHAGEAHWARIKPNDRVTLRRERGNRHDPRAVAVEWQGVMLGYVPREANYAVSQVLDRGGQVEGRIARLQSGQDPWKRIGLELYAYPIGSRAPGLQIAGAGSSAGAAPGMTGTAAAAGMTSSIAMPVKSATIPWHKFGDPPPNDGTFGDALRILLLSHDEIGRRLALPALAVSHLGRRSVRLWDAIEISVSDAGHDLKARFLDAWTTSPQLTADLTKPIGTYWSAAFVPCLARECDESQVPRKVLAGPSGRWIHASLRRTFEGHVDLGELRRRLLAFLAPDVLARSLANRIFVLPATAQEFNWVARHKEPIALSAIEHPRLLPFFRYLPDEPGKDEADPIVSLKAHFTGLGMAPAAFARLERWGFDAFVAYDTNARVAAHLLKPPAIVEYANLLLEIDAIDPPPALFAQLAEHVAAREVDAPDWFMRTLLRATTKAPDDDPGRLTNELDDALDWLVECKPQPDANQRKSGWPWIVDESWAYRAKRNAPCWPVPCGEIRIGPAVIVPLRNAVELREEADAMHNCLATYASLCSDGDVAVFSIREARTGKRLACFLAECVLDHEGAGKWAISEIKGKMNRPVGPRVAAIAMAAVGKMNGG